MENTNFRNYMEADEFIIWQGKPEKGNYFRRENIASLPFGLFFFAFACVWAAAASQGSPFFALFALPFMAVGLYVSFGTIIHRAIMLSKTEYAITNKKLIRISGQRVDIVRADQIDAIQIEMNKNGTGTIIFRNSAVYHHSGNKIYTNYPGTNMGFYSIENIRDVITVQHKINEMEK